MSEPNAQPAVPKQWRVENVKDKSVSFDCPACKEHYQFDAKVFAAKSTENVAELVKTDQFVRRTYGQNFLAIIAALIVYYYAHQWINGEGTPLNQGVLIPVFIAVVVYSILKPFFSAGLFSGKGIPIYTFDCRKCHINVFVASDGKSIALPVSSPATKAEPQTTESATPTDDPTADEVTEQAAQPTNSVEAAQPTTSVEAATADTMRSKFLEAGAVCWYCQKNKLADGKPHNVVVFKKEGGERIEKTIWVPRCSACDATHQRQDPLHTTVLTVSIIAFIGLCILIGALGAKPMGGWAWVVGIVVSLIGFSIAAVTIQKIIQRQAHTAGTRILGLANSEFSEVKDLIAQGWELDATKTGKAA